MKVTEVIKKLQETLELGNDDAEVRIDFGRGDYKETLGISFDDYGDVLIYEVAGR